MDFEKIWKQALKETEIIRARVAALNTVEDTRVPYVMLAESTINVGDTIVRCGEVVVNKPALLLPPNNPQFNGFEFDQDEDEAFNETSMVNFLLVRGITLPSFNYDNKTVKLDLYEGSLSSAIKHYEQELQSQENIKTGLIKGSEEFWPFSLLIFMCAQVAKNADIDIRRLLDQHNKNK